MSKLAYRQKQLLGFSYGIYFCTWQIDRLTNRCGYLAVSVVHVVSPTLRTPHKMRWRPKQKSSPRDSVLSRSWFFGRLRSKSQRLGRCTSSAIMFRRLRLRDDRLGPNTASRSVCNFDFSLLSGILLMLVFWKIYTARDVSQSKRRQSVRLSQDRTM